MSKPITPAQVLEKKKAVIPDFVIDVVNNLILQNMDGDVAAIGRHEILGAIFTASRDMNFLTPFKDRTDKWLKRIPEVFQSAGWTVDYIERKPECENSYQSTYFFRAPS